jgi:endonuclease YncB( thermonuclease family)
MAHGKDARIECHKVDRFGREVCKLWGPAADCPRRGKTLDVGLAQISVGLAWWFRRYADEQSLEDRGRYQSEEEEARLRKRGLWADPTPTAPWEWRRSPH